MKTKLVRPVLVESNNPVQIGSIMKYIKLFPFHDDDVDKPVGSLVLNKNFNIVSSNQYWKHCQLILISLEDDKIEEDALVLVDGGLGRIGLDKFQNNVKYSIRPKKVIATQSQLSPEYIQQFIEEYNKGEVKDFKIEMEDRFGYCAKCNAYQFASFITCNYRPSCGGKIIQKDEPKLTNGYVTIVNKEVPTYTEEEVYSIMQQYLENYVWSNGKYITPKEWFNQHKK